MAGEYRQNPRSWIVYKIQAYPRPTTPEQLQGQTCELDVAGYPEGFGWGLWQQQSNEYPWASGPSYGRGQSDDIV